MELKEDDIKPSLPEDSICASKGLGVDMIGLAGCVKCPVGTFGDGKLGFCQTCPRALTSSPGRASCKALCGDGQIYLSGDICVPCASCIPCATCPNAYTCKDEGYEPNYYHGQYTACTVCRAGFHKSNGVCLKCSGFTDAFKEPLIAIAIIALLICTFYVVHSRGWVKDVHFFSILNMIRLKSVIAILQMIALFSLQADIFPPWFKELTSTFNLISMPFEIKFACLGIS